MADNNVKVTKSKGKWGIETFTASPVPLPKPASEFARLKHPGERGLYYDKLTGGWVRHGWTVWKMAEWEATFGGGFNPATGRDSEGRLWEFFGYTIPLKVAE